MHIGEIIHANRIERKLTLLELSQKSGVALATLSRIENGKMTGTLKSHMSISNALEISLPDLYKNLTSSKKQIEVEAKKAKTDVFVHDKDTSSEMLASKSLNKKMMPVIIRITAGGKTQKEEAKPGVERFLYILDGKIEAMVGDERYSLTKGDSLYFESSLPHHFANTGKSEARLLSVTCPPSL